MFNFFQIKIAPSIRKVILRMILSAPKENSILIEILQLAESNNMVDIDTQAMMEGALMVSEMQVRDIMLPSSEITSITITDEIKDIQKKMASSGHSRFPVFDETGENVLGILLAKDLLASELTESENKIKSMLRSPVFVPESKKLNILLREFKANRNHLAVVVDEYGKVSGLVSIEDVLEQIVGNIDDEHDYEDEENIRQHGKERFTVKSRTSIDEFADYFNMEILQDDYETVGGLVTKLLGHVPAKGEEVKYEGLTFKVLRADQRRSHLLRIIREQNQQKTNGKEDS
ncbi:MAG: transporter associated domain-containing protein [Pseudomonadota bacterium]|nr:transporter associated domain-containing protein [Pseudomonadota bacterium]